MSANLSATRRGVNKSSSEVSSQSIEKDDDSEKTEAKEVKQESERKTIISTSQTSSSDDVSSNNSVPQDSDNKVAENDATLNHKSLDVTPAGSVDDDETVHDAAESPGLSNSNASTFKTPLQPRPDAESPGSSASQSTANKFRRFKIAPRLNTSRNVPKAQVSCSRCS